MSNDIDSILNSMFKDGRLILGSEQRNQEDAKKALDAVEKQNEIMANTLQENIERLTKETQAELTHLETRLKEDGLKDAKNEDVIRVNQEPEKLKSAFQRATDEVEKSVLGQDAFIHALALTFKRPLVAGVQDGMPLSRSVIIGKNGTGKHAALEQFTSQLQANGALSSGEVAYIDLSKYRDAASAKAFLQDLYPALKGNAQVVAFERFELCHQSVLSMVRSLFTEGKIHMPGRYVQQKNMLIDIGTALAPNAVSTLQAEGKYLFLLTDKKEKYLLEKLGASFLSHCDDIIKTQTFTRQDIEGIVRRILSSFCAEVKEKLGFSLAFADTVVAALTESFIPDEGVPSIMARTKRLYRMLAEHKLRDGAGQNGIIYAEGKEICITVDGVKLADIEQGQLEKEAAVKEIKQELDDIVGLQEVKDYVLSLEANYQMQQMRREKGMKAEFPTMHMIFTGNPGTGKTTIARIVSRYLKAIGVLSQGQLVEVTRADLVGQYVGHTAPLTQKAIDAAIGGVLFVDEAYSLFRGKEDSFGLEAIDTLVKGMEDNRDNLVVILAGYSKEMADFLSANSGLKSRFPNQIEFPDYSAEELLAITKRIVDSKGYLLHPDCDLQLLSFYREMQIISDPRTGGNGRMARNKVEEAILSCSKRNMALNEMERNLELLLPEDFGLFPSDPIVEEKQIVDTSSSEDNNA